MSTIKRISFILAALCAISVSAHAQQVVKQSTERIVKICDVFDNADLAEGTWTPITNFSLSVADEAVAIPESGSVIDIKSATWAAITGADGCYNLTLSSTATGTIGALTVRIRDADIAPVTARFQVVSEEVYDACCASSSQPVTVADIWSYNGGRTITGGTISTVSDKTGYSLSSSQTFSTTGSVGSVTGAVGSVTGNVGGTINGLTSTAQGHLRSGIGLSSANLDTQLGALATASNLSALALVADAIKAKTDNLNFTVSGFVDSNVQYINDSEITGDGSSTPFDVAE